MLSLCAFIIFKYALVSAYVCAVRSKVRNVVELVSNTLQCLEFALMIMLCSIRSTESI